MSVRQICVRDVDTAELTESVLAAAQRMHARNVGSLVVVDKDRRPLGIVTDRDLMVRALVECCDPAKACVWEVMSQLPQTVDESVTIEEALAIMRSGPYRRLPVVNHEGRLVGLVSLDDVLKLLAAEFCEINKLLRKESPEVLATVS
jgi:CBS domain-containing protein